MGFKERALRTQNASRKHPGGGGGGKAGVAQTAKDSKVVLSRPGCCYFAHMYICFQLRRCVSEREPLLQLHSLRRRPLG